MASMTVNCGSFNKTSYSGVTQYGSVVNFYPPEGATVTGCSVSFTTHPSGGDTADRAFSLNGARAHPHSGWAKAGALDAGLLRGGNNTFRVTLKSQTPSGGAHFGEPVPGELGVRYILRLRAEMGGDLMCADSGARRTH